MAGFFFPGKAVGYQLINETGYAGKVKIRNFSNFSA